MERVSATAKTTKASTESLDWKKKEIARALANMGLFRQAAMEKRTIHLYAERLAELELEDVLSALKAIEDLPRDEGDTAFPSMGVILKMVEVEHIARYNREAAAKDVEYVAWKCHACGGTSGNSYPTARKVYEETRYCQRPAQQVRPQAKGNEVCGGNLRVVYRGASSDVVGKERTRL